MIRKIDAYIVICDGCGQKFVDEDGTGFSIFMTEKDADDFAACGCWSSEGEKYFCENCSQKKEEKKRSTLNK